MSVKRSIPARPRNAVLIPKVGDSLGRDGRRIEAVIFDLDDTLIDWANPIISREEFYYPRVANVHSFIVEAGFELPPVDEFFHIVDQAVLTMWAEAKKNWQITTFGRIFYQVLEGLSLPIEKLDVDEVLQVFGWGPRPGVTLFPDTLDVLKELRLKNYRVGLLTNSFLPMWVRDVELDAYQLLEYLDARISAADVGYLKPHPLIYEAILDKLQTTAQRAVFVGDRPKNDIAGANAVGLISILIDPPHLNRDLEGVIPDYTITCLRELLPILEELEKNRV